jgi:outer membrane usher protein
MGAPPHAPALSPSTVTVRGRLAFLLLVLIVLAAGMPARAADAPVAPPAAAASGELYLEVRLNGRPTGSVMRFVQRPGTPGLRAQAEDLRTLGIEPGLAGQGDIDLDGMRGLTYVFDAAAQSIDLRVADAVRTPFLVDTRPVRTPGIGSASPGAVLNYDIYARSGAGAQTSVLTEARLFNDRGVFSSTALVQLQGEQRRALRYDTSWSHADPVTLTSYQVGDFISRSVPWSRSIRMGGVEWRKNFDLRPDVLTYPVPQIGGSAVVPSSVALYVNQMKQYAGTVPDGPFVLNQVAGLNGAGQATLVTRDALGRDVATSIPLYIDTRMLAPGYDDVALGAGLVRRNYGFRSFSYAPQPAITGSLRRGLSDRFTLEAHGEGSARLANAGAGMLARVGDLGVVSGAVAASRAGGADAIRGSGVQATVGYQYLSPRYSIDAQSTRASRRYADLGSLEGTPVVRANDRVTVNAGLPHGQNLSMSYVGLRLGTAPMARIAALAYGVQLTPRSNLTVNAYRDLDNVKARGVMATFSLTLPGRIGASASAGSQSGGTTRTLALARAGEVAVSPGWSVQQGAQNGSHYVQGQAQYVGSMAQYSATLQRDSSSTQASLGMTGSIVAMHGRVLPARQTGSAFALVSTGLPDITVLHENRPVGRTDRHGDLLVPNLVPYAVNRLGIDAEELPLELQVDQTSLEIVPQRLAGVLAQLEVKRYDGATVKLVDGAGKPVPGGATVAFATGAAPTIVGYDGVVFVAHVQAENVLEITWPDDPATGAGPRAGQCTARFSYDSRTAAPGATLGPLVCQPTKAIAP